MIGVALANGALAIANGIFLHHVIDTSRTLREATAALPPHPCRSVILPGEKCEMHMLFEVPDSGGDRDGNRL